MKKILKPITIAASVIQKYYKLGKAAIKKVIKKMLITLLPFYKKALDRIENLENYIKKNEIREIKNQDINIRKLYNTLLDFKLKYEKPEAGSAQWLVLAEYKYGGVERKVKRNVVSEFDPRTKEKLARSGYTGGDRMNELEHNYAPVYSRYLKPFVDNHFKGVLIEVGILKGTGLAIWSELFKDGRIIGLDIDLGNIKGNLENLKRRGAFKNNNIELYEFDQFLDNREIVADILKGEKISIIIDDGFHSDDSILNTMKCVLPYLKDTFLYIIEDNKTVNKKIINLYPHFKTINYGFLTVVTP